MSKKIKFANPTQSFFYATLRSRVDEYFRLNKLSRHANGQMWIKTIFFLVGFAGLYLLIISGTVSPLVMLLLTALLGMFCAFVGFNICHDAIHGSLSGNKKINKLFSFTFNLVGANPYVWNITHNIVHHTYTNIPDHDEDIEVAPGLIRITDEEEVNAIQRYQHWYALPLYSLASLSWVFRKDFKKFFQSKIGEHTVKHPGIEYFNLFFYKLIYYVLFIVLPLVLLDISWIQFIAGFLVLHFAQGLTMGLVFQLAHVVEGTKFPKPNEQGTIEEVWAEHQMHTTANFATNNRIAAFFLGGLNRQIEHHLFPKVCHIHYGAISKIVKATALAHNLPYIESKTFTAALRSHLTMLKRFGKYAENKQEKLSRPAVSPVTVLPAPGPHALTALRR
ncbi:fatty acid desaturase family protein [Pedobacter sp. MR2016-24]|uniref:fatty acid desaturase family protein n=1 Tax=Pedobacter sp. MR2016-24 TaxID=2994466 RepID=UPI0022464D9C|nr:acyl-CoA desaturase [Pedobacter sp. MR2016-24]MCX2484017.1 acyl-CoA desaturase [Pedobacter sp. MR2016-24]